MVETSVIIRFREAVTESSLDFVKSQGAVIQYIYKSINAISAKVPKDKIGKIKADPRVLYLEIDQEAHILGFPEAHTPIEIRKALALSQTVPYGITKIRAPEVHQTGNKGTGMKVCVVDTGIDYNHPDLAANYKGGYNFISNTSDPKDDHGHGTHVSGTIAALDNNIGVIGVAPEAYIYAAKVLDQNGSGSYASVTAGIQWAIDNKMQIVSMSLGGSSFSQALKDVCDAAYNGGILLVAAAGNSGSDTDTIGYPAKFDSVIAVGATDSNDNRANFSSVGPKLEVAAPGVLVLSTVPTGTCSMCDPSGYRLASGTSMATPHTSGAAALIMKAHPEFANVDVRNVLQKSAKDLGPPGRDIYYGFGRIDVKAAIDYIPPKKYKCTGAPDYQCIEDPNGPYEGIDACLAVCKPPRFKCTGAPDYQCVQDPNGPYASLDECLAACKPPRYRCTGAPDYQCVQDPNGPFDTLEKCLCVCKAPKKYRCENNTCIEDPNGTFDNIEECVANCWDKTWKWSCISIYDTNGNVVNTYCKPDLNGKYNTLADCQADCRKLRPSRV